MMLFVIFGTTMSKSERVENLGRNCIFFHRWELRKTLLKTNLRLDSHNQFYADSDGHQLKAKMDGQFNLRQNNARLSIKEFQRDGQYTNNAR